jgi:NAD-dependent deacetylase
VCSIVTDQVQVAADLIQEARLVTVLTGAGLSTASGIPDFRGPQGLWTKDPGAARMFDIDAYVRDPELRIRAWQNRRDHPAWTAEPNPGHRALAWWEDQGRVRATITQNIDGLHQAAGSGRRAPVLEVHGTLHRTICLDCGERRPMRETLDRLADTVDPPCLACGGMLKSDTVSFGQSLDAATLEQASRAAREGNVFLAAGTSLQVNPVASVVPTAWQYGARVVICNAGETPYDSLADAVVREPLEEVLPIIVGAPTAEPLQ